MTIGKREREENQREAFAAILDAVGDGAFDTTLFDATSGAFREILRTTWEDLMNAGSIESISANVYRLTPKGWLAATELSGAAQSELFMERLGRVLAAMKAHVKGRRDSKTVDLQTLAAESGEPEGFIFNIIESRASSSEGKRRGAQWLERAHGRLVAIPVDFNMEPVDVAAALTVPHLERIEALEERLERVEEDRARYHCPYCDAELISSGSQDFPEHHAIVTFDRFACGLLTADGFDEEPCPYSSSWPRLDEFEFDAKENGASRTWGDCCLKRACLPRYSPTRRTLWTSPWLTGCRPSTPFSNDFGMNWIISPVRDPINESR